MVAVGGQVCVGMEQEEKKPLEVRVSDKSSELHYKTPRHLNKAELQRQSRKFTFVVDAVPGAEHVSPSKEPVHQKEQLKVELPKSTWAVVKELAECDSALKAELLKKELEERHAKHLARKQ